MQAFVDFLNARFGLSAETCKLLRSHISIRYIPSRKFIRSAGDPSDAIFYIRKGLVHLYRKREECDWLSCEDQVICPFDRFIKQEPSSVFYETLEPTEVHVISYESYRQLATKSDFRNAIYHTIIDRLYRVNKFLTVNNGSATQRYAAFAEFFPGLANRVPVNLIAAFLDVSSKTVSRIRSGQNVYKISDSVARVVTMDSSATEWKKINTTSVP